MRMVTRYSSWEKNLSFNCKNIFLIPCFFIQLIILNDASSFELQKWEKNPKNLSQIKNLVKKIRKKDLNKLLRQFVRKTRPGRLIGTEGHSKAINFLKTFEGHQLIEESFKPDWDFAHKLYEKDFENKIAKNFPKDSKEFQTWRTFTDNILAFMKKKKKTQGTNIIWEKQGVDKPNEIILLAAHYDSIALDKKDKSIIEDKNHPGANDNGSAVAILLNVIKIFSKLELKKTVRVVFFDMQEFASLGARAYIEKYLNEFKGGGEKKITHVLNLEMLGFDSKSTDIEKKTGNFKMYITKAKNQTYQKEKELAEAFQKKGKALSPQIKFKIEANGLEIGDSASFWDKGIAVLSFSHNWESDFDAKGQHTINDFPERINFRTLERSAQFIVGGALALALEIEK